MTKRSLVDFVMDARRRECKVCQLPDDVRSQFKVARSRQLPNEIVIEWLQSEGYDITGAEYMHHFKARHDKPS